MPFILLIGAVLAAAGPGSIPSASAAGRAATASFPEDLGSGAIDVSGYPPDLQRTYKEIFLPVFSFLGGAARAVNSPVIELDPRLEEAERRRNPLLFSDPALALVSRDGWRRRVEEIRRRPPCCGACPVLSREGAKALWRFLVYDSIARKTGPRAADWMRLRRSLVNRHAKERQT